MYDEYVLFLAGCQCFFNFLLMVGLCAAGTLVYKVLKYTRLSENTASLPNILQFFSGPASEVPTIRDKSAEMSSKLFAFENDPIIVSEAASIDEDHENETKSEPPLKFNPKCADLRRRRAKLEKSGPAGILKALADISINSLAEMDVLNLKQK